MSVAGIVENYTDNYIYMTPSVYESVYGAGAIVYNVILVEMFNENQKNALANELLENPNVTSFTFSDDIVANYARTMGSLNIIAYIIILAAGILAFIILNNLVNINISERRNELGTMKMLGFYNLEVAQYIYRENFIAIIVGLAIGVLLGIPFSHFLVISLEVEHIMFNNMFGLAPFIYSTVITLIVALFVNFLAYFELRKIDISEGNKTVM